MKAYKLCTGRWR